MSPRSKKVLVVCGCVVATLLVAAIGYSIGSALSTNPMLVTGSRDGFVGSTPSPMTEPGAPAAGVAQSTDAAKSTEAEGGSASTVPLPSSDRLLIVTASMDLRVDDVDSSLTALRASVAKAGGEVSDLSVSSGNGSLGPMPLDSSLESVPDAPSSAVVTIRVPADKLDSLTDDISALGRVLSQSATASDVTEQSIDLEARLRNLRAEEVRLRSFLGKTDRVVDLLAVERELARVRGEIEAMDAQLTYLKRQAAKATLTVSLTEPGPVVQPSGTTWGLREAITRGFQVTAALIGTMVTLAIPLSFLAAVLLVIALPIRWLVRRRRARLAGRTTETANDEERE